MNIDNIFSTKERVKIIKNVIYKKDQISVGHIADELRLSKGLVSKYLDILVKEKILKRSKNKFSVLNNINVKGIRILLNLNNFNETLFKRYEFIKGVGLYGSFVNGTNTEESDIDLWIKIEKAKEKNLAELTNNLKKIGNIKPLFLTKEKIYLLKRDDKTFFYSLVFGSIVLYGESIEV